MWSGRGSGYRKKRRGLGVEVDFVSASPLSFTQPPGPGRPGLREHCQFF